MEDNLSNIRHSVWIELNKKKRTIEGEHNFSISNPWKEKKKGVYSISHQTSLKATLCDSFGTELIGHDFLLSKRECKMGNGIYHQA